MEGRKETRLEVMGTSVTLNKEDGLRSTCMFQTNLMGYVGCVSCFCILTTPQLS